MPTLYPKCSPSELLGLLSLVKRLKGSEEIARIADDESLAVDDILPSIEYAEGLGLISVSDGRVSFTESGKKLAAGTIRAKKELLREALRKTTLFRAILRSLEAAVDGCLAEDELQQIVAFTTAPPDAVQNIVTWGRYTELFRYDANRHAILPAGTRGKPKVAPAIPAPPASPPPAAAPPPPPPPPTAPPAAKPRATRPSSKAPVEKTSPAPGGPLPATASPAASPKKREELPAS
ncbi:MAG: AAA-associated domain-containing protein [Euryarchaeota archaeon]|nr:AAA-associated domain-containing protein [Euryarchaeota archaeon]MDE1835241.1 AAA-associated domain-containing protein [Euryarchaeota archaeon]MDE1881044.1 AAA-associated domain-containing protein [Euryarchaeota archaeon]MDE2043537.1 AAA-associated domain-containing protein [Thermoplasmata archaeon]